jgi:hypothetical protein
LRDTGGDASLGTFSSEIDASWLGTIPSTEEQTDGATGLLAPESPAEEPGTLEAGA